MLRMEMSANRLNLTLFPHAPRRCDVKRVGLPEEQFRSGWRAHLIELAFPCVPPCPLWLNL